MEDRLQRREFIKLGVGGLVGAGLGGGSAFAAPEPAAPPRAARASNIRIGRRVPIGITDEEMAFLHQIGVTHVAVEGNEDDFEPGRCLAIRERLVRHGLGWHGGFNRLVRDPAIGFGLSGRDEKIEKFQEYIRLMGRLGVDTIMYPWNPGGNTWTNDREVVRGQKLRAFDLARHDPRARIQAGTDEYPAEHMWSTYEYFMKAILPTCEEAGVRMALHADDPPVEMMHGVARLFTNAKALLRAQEIAGGSRHWTFLMCVGTWGQVSDEGMGMTLLDGIRHFAGAGQLAKVHFRNVGAPLPRFYETFIDEGYVDMQRVMDTLVEVGFDGLLVEDHLPPIEGDTPRQFVSTAYTIAWIRAMHRRALETRG